jgi:tetratricopeptide (TPR) repeat protein
VAAERARELARLSGSGLELVRAHLWRSEAAAYLGNAAEAAIAARRALERGRALDAPQEMARGQALLAANDGGEARRALDELAAIGEELEGRSRWADAGYALAQMGDYWLRAGHNREAQTVLERALQSQSTAGDRRAMIETLRLLALAVCRSGEPAVAIGYLEEATALAEATGDRYLRLACRLATGEALLAQRQHVAAEATLRQVIATAEDPRRLGNWRELPRAYGLLVEALNEQGRRDEARLVAASAG